MPLASQDEQSPTTGTNLFPLTRQGRSCASDEMTREFSSIFWPLTYVALDVWSLVTPSIRRQTWLPPYVVFVFELLNCTEAVSLPPSFIVVVVLGRPLDGLGEIGRSWPRRRKCFCT